MKKKIKAPIISFAKKHHWLMVIIRALSFAYGRMKYMRYYRSTEVDEKMVMFESFMGRQYSCSPKAIYLEMLNNEKCKDYKFVWAFKNPEEYKFLEQNRNTIVINYSNSEFLKYHAMAKYWVTNSRIKEIVKKKENQVFIQCWHGTPLKKLGYDIEVAGGNAMNSIKDIQKKYTVDSNRYTYMISPSAFCTEKFASAFNLANPSIIKETGYPRNDYLYNYTENDAKKIKSTLGIPENKKIILYAPTWRDNQHKAGVGYTYKLSMDFDKMKAELGDDYVVLFRTHYFIANYIDLTKYEGFVYNVSQYPDINDLYIISDILITDYSSVFFDFANLRRPILFYMYDIEEYKNNLRDFYIDFSELPGPIIETEDKLFDEIKNIDGYYAKYIDTYKAFVEKFNYLDDGKSSKRVVENLILN